MNKQKIAELRAGLETGFINSGYNSSLAYQPQFLSNNHKEGKKVLSSIEDELMACDKFQISVAFITMGGITPLLQTLKELEKNGIPGEILTTNYLNFSEPKALEKLHGLSNITLKMYDVEKAAEGFHTKGYIFKKFYFYQDLSKDDDIPKNMQNDFLHQMYKEFGTIEEEYFYDRLEDGKYDEGFKERQVKEKKSR